MFVIRKQLRPLPYFYQLLGKCPKQASANQFSTASKDHGRKRGVDDDAEGDDLKGNPFFEKYQEKIRKAKEAGVYTAPKDKYSNVLHRETQSWKKNIQKLEKRLDQKKKDEAKISGLKLPAKLDSLMKVELLEGKTAAEISKIWSEYWSGKDTISAVITKEVFNAMVQRFHEYPMFIYPIPREQGYEFHLTQFNNNHCFCTSLINYQVSGEDAPWQLCFKFYPELLESKGIALMACEFDNACLSLLEAQYLANLQQLFYASPTDKRVGLLINFNQFPDHFKYMDVIKELESADFIVKR